MWDVPSEDGQPAVPVNLPAPAVSVAVSIPVLTEVMLANLAREIAKDINEPLTIIGHFGLSVEQFDVIKQNPFFIRVLAAEITSWKSAGNTEQRLKLSAAAILEEGLPKLGARMMKEGEPLPAAVETGKLLTKIAGIGEATVGPMTPGEKFTITINIGADKVEMKDVTLKTAPVSLESA